MFRIYCLLIFAVILAACDDEEGGRTFMGMDIPYDYCSDHVCLSPSEKVHRPTVFQIKRIVADSNDFVYLNTVSCQLLPGENADSIYPLCVDSVKFSGSDSLHYLPQIDFYDRYAYEKIDVPVDSDNHLRFTLVDKNREEKSFDINLNIYVDMHQKNGDTISFSFPQGLSRFEGVTLDTNFDKALLPEETDFDVIDTCYWTRIEYEYNLDTTYECCSIPAGVKREDRKDAVENRSGIFRLVDDPTRCVAPDTLLVRYQNWEYKKVSCYHFRVEELMEDLTLIDLRSLEKMQEITGATDVLKEGFHNKTWEAEFHLGHQGSMKIDSLIIEIMDPYGYYN